MAFRLPTPGAVIESKYRLAERIGGGGMGDVYRAESLATNRLVAVKFLHPELAQNMEVSQRFFQEAQAVNRIRHPNVVEVLDAGVGEMGPYIVMEYLEGESVGSALSRTGRFETDAAVGAVMPVLEALDAAHRVGIIHRDLKPENVFIAYDSVKNVIIVRLLDFGIAKVIDANNGPGPRTRTGVVFGTPDYLSPEQATGDAPLDGRSDLFAVGSLLYELLTGMRPFRAPTAVATAFKVVHAEAPAMSTSGVHVDARLEGIVQKLLQKDPAKRFATAGDVSREIEKVSPDPARRMLALAKVAGVARRVAMAQSVPDSERLAAALDSAASRRLSAPESPSLATQVSARVPTLIGSPRAAEPPPPRALERPKIARPVLVDLPKTLRSAVPLASAADATPRALPAIRPFPQRHLGKFQVRGPVLRSVDKVVIELFGAEARDEVVSCIPEGWSADLRNDAINALVAYDLELVDAYLEYASALLFRDPGRWREVGRASVDGELHSVVRTLLRPSVELASVLRRGVSTWGRLFSFGTWRVGTAPSGKVALTLGELDAVSMSLRLWIVGMVEQTCRRAVRAELRVIITQGDQDFAPELVCEVG